MALALTMLSIVAILCVVLLILLFQRNPFKRTASDRLPLPEKQVLPPLLVGVSFAFRDPD